MQAQIAVASRALRRFSGVGPTASLGPTPERLLKARGLAHIEMAVDTEGSAAMQVPRIRVTASPLEEMARRRRLDPDRDRAAAMLSAGRRYLALWTKAGLQPLKGMDPSAIRTTAVGAGFVGTAAKQEAWDEYLKASRAMDAKERAAVDGVVLHEATLEAVGRRIDRGMVTDRASVIAIASHELRAGLQCLAVHFGTLSDEETIAPEPVTAELPAEMMALLDIIERREGAPS